MMRRLALPGALALAAATPRAAAEPVVRFAASERAAGQVTLASGFEDALAPLSLSGALAIPARRTVTAWADLTLPLLRPDLADHAAELGATAPVLDRPWDVRVGGALREVSTRNDAFAATSLGSLLVVRLGRYAPRWTTSLEGELWTAWATHLRTTPYAQDPGGASAWHGWSALTAASAKLGVQAGGLIGPIELAAHLGYETRGKMNLVIPPLYATTHVGYRF